jgi:hypothetical protein
MILDIEEDKVHPIILGRPFLATNKAVIDMDLAKLTLRREEEELVIKIHTKEDDKCCKLEWKEKKTEVPPTPKTLACPQIHPSKGQIEGQFCIFKGLIWWGKIRGLLWQQLNILSTDRGRVLIDNP